MRKVILAMLAVVLVFGLTFAGCNNDGGGPGNPNNPGGGNIPTSGRLTITGLDAYNGKYIQATGTVGDDLILAFQDISGDGNNSILGTIRNGSVTLNVWKRNLGDLYHPYISFNGSGAATIAVYIMNSNSTNGNGAGQGAVSVTFSNGVGSGVYQSYW